MSDIRQEYAEEEWSLIIKPTSGWLEFKLDDLWKYRDLLFMFVKRDFVAVYQQTILGPIWYFLQPVLTTLTFTIVFGNIAQISTDGLPQLLFYMSGIIGWNYFSDCLNATSGTFSSNAAIFGKVYFPRLIAPLSTVISNLIKFSIQFLLFLGFMFYFLADGKNVNPNMTILITPVLILLMAGLGLGFGIIISSLTTKYRDLKFLVTFGVQLLMYATPVIYPLSTLPDKYRIYVMANPMTPVIETFRYAYLGGGSFDPLHLVYSGIFMVVVLFIALVIFNKVEKTFMDTV
ncbi:MAG: ABC transporter permease [Bacteroidota bacterium]|jgi:lipopolysaccharide transport system permease protein|nr:ABC transporter permease [Bacteroidota bacterium]